MLYLDVIKHYIPRETIAVNRAIRSKRAGGSELILLVGQWAGTRSAGISQRRVAVRSGGAGHAHANA